MKPHEETWYYDVATGVLFRQVGAKPDDDTDRSIDMPHSDTGGNDAFDARETLKAAAPEMARRLLTHVLACEACNGSGLASIRTPEGRNAVPCPTCEDDRAALAKAGVVP